MDLRRSEAEHANGVAAGSLRRRDGLRLAAAHLAAMTDGRHRLLARMQALLEEIDRCEPGEEDWW